MSEKSPWELYKEKNKGIVEHLSKTVKPWDMINPTVERADESLANERYNICQACPELIKLTKQCKKCGCFMAAKTKLLKAVCPLNKW
jgi:GH35 family endo-1,4-beta-xylanase